MEDLNQLKLILVKNKKTNKWLAEQLGLIKLLFQNGVPIQHSLIWQH